MQAALLNGESIDPEQPAIYLNDRGWQYGDGLFETMLLKHGKLRFVDDHLQRLRSGCSRLGIAAPTTELLLPELQRLCGSQQHGIVRLTITRGRGERGYRASMQSTPTRLCQLFDPPQAMAASGITVRWCTTQLSRNALLAGIKHCNRLEQVIAQSEWNDPLIAEGLMLDTEGELVCATMSNVFLVLDDMLITPDLRYCGVSGVMRKNLLRLAQQLQIAIEERAVRAEEVLTAREMFVCNAIRGIRPVLQLEQQRWPIGAVTSALMNQLEAC